MKIGSSILFDLYYVRKLFILLLALSNLTSFAQEKKMIRILHADSMASNKFIANNAQRLLGNVLFEHNNALMNCDSAYSYANTNNVEAFGNVHINQGDTTHLYSDRIFYNGDISFARSFGNVRLESKNAILYTDTLDFDLVKNIGYYDCNGKIVDSTNILTSVVGRYFIDQDLVYFIRDVKGHSEKYDLYSDSLYYNTKTERIFIESPTTIKDSANILFAKDGWYDTKTGQAYLLEDPVVYNKTQQLKANIIEYSRERGKGLATGAVNIFDSKNSTVVKGEWASYDDNLKTALVSDSAVMIMYSKEDSLYLHADTLRTVPDTIENEKVFKAYYGVRFWRTDIQGVCDSLNYFSKDSTVQLYVNPILWSENRQLTSDYVEMKSNTNIPDEVRLKNDAFIISKFDTVRFDQIKGKNMIGYIVDNKLSRIEVDGNGQSLYYAEDKNEIIGLNKAESSKISVRFINGKIDKIVFISDAVGTLNPIFQVANEDRKLQGFDWKEGIRPLSKNDIFRK
jgi:hypothetical protein